MRTFLDETARAFAIGIAAVEIVGAVAFLTLVLVIGEAVQTPDPIGSTIVIGLAVLNFLLPAVVIYYAFNSKKGSVGYFCLLLVIGYPAALFSLYAAYA